MDLRTFEIKMVDYHFAELPGGIYLFKRKHGRWCVWNSETDEEKEFDSLHVVFPYKPAGDKTVKELIESLETMDSRLDGGRGAGSGQVFSFGHAPDENGLRTDKSDLPVRMNIATTTKTPEGAIAAFRKAYGNSNVEHGISIGQEGYTNRLVHGMSHSVAIGPARAGDLIVHNHPGGGSFSDSDLISTARDRSRGIVATHPKGYRIFTKMSHFDAEKFTRALKRARPRGKNYDDAVDKWLKRNQRKYHYRFANVLD